MNWKVFTVLGVVVGCVVCWDSEDYYENDFVDPTDMGSYSHGARSNVKPAKTRFQMEQRYEYTSKSESDSKSLNVAKPETSLKLRDYSGGVSPPCIYQCPTLDETIVMNYLKRIVATLLEQMKVRSHVFGPGESITIDLRAEMFHEDFTTLNSFIKAKDDESVRYLEKVDRIISELFSLSSHPPNNLVEYFKEWIEMRMPALMSFKFWLSFISLMVVGFITVMLCLQFAQSRHHPARFILYGTLIFFVLSCIWSYAELQEEKKAQSAARLEQYDAVPSDCDYNNLGAMESMWYFARVKVAGYPDQCEEYHKEIGMDPFHRASPIEAISVTFSKLIFAPMEYIGDKMGKFLAGTIKSVPFWIKPIVLVLIFVFGFLGCFGYRIRTPFISIEPVSRPRILESPEHAQNRNQAIIERPVVPIVPLNSRDASTSTDDLEDYILQQNNYRPPNAGFLGPPPRSRSDWTYFCDILISGLATLYAKVLQLLSTFLRDMPGGPGDLDVYDDGMEMELIWEHPRFNHPRPIMPDEDIAFPVAMPLPEVVLDEAIIYPPAAMPMPVPEVEDDKPTNRNPAEPDMSRASSSSSDDHSIQISAFGWVNFEDDELVVEDMPSTSTPSSSGIRNRRKGIKFSLQSPQGSSGIGWTTEIDQGIGFDHLLEGEDDADKFYSLVLEDGARKRKRDSSPESESEYFNMTNDTGFSGMGEDSLSLHELDERPSTSSATSTPNVRTGLEK